MELQYLDTAARDYRLNVTILSPYRTMNAPTMLASDSALNWYSSMLGRALSERGIKVRILAPTSLEKSTIPWHDDTVLVVPCYQRDNPLSLFNVVKEALSADDPIIHVQHELFAYGGIIGAFLVPLIIRKLRSRGKIVLTTIHGVIPLNAINNNFVRGNGIKAPTALVKVAWRYLIRAVVKASDAVHVHEDQHAVWLRKNYGLTESKIFTIPLGLDLPESEIPVQVAREKIGIPLEARIVLFFGFFAQYKGLEILAREAEKILNSDLRIVIVIAGGVPKRLSRQGEATLSALRRLAEAYSGRVRLTGFIPEEQVNNVMRAADVLILPYTINMAASGPFGLAVSNGTPILMSETFATSHRGYAGSFSLAKGGLATKVLQYFESTDLRDTARKFLTIKRNEMAWPKVSLQFISVYREMQSRSSDKN